MNEITNTVTMSLADFLAMRDNEENFFSLLDAILENADLAYFGDEIRFSDDAIRTALKFIAPERLNEREKALMERREAEKED